VNREAMADARQLHDRLTKPRGSLGRLEDIGVRLAGIAGHCPPPAPEPATVAVFAGDHGVVAEGVTPWPQEVTAQMVANFCAGGAAVNVLARQAGVNVVVVDVGVAVDIESGAGIDGDSGGLLRRNVRRGTRNMTVEPAMTAQETDRALAVGRETAAMCVDRGARCLVTGDMGIGNTTASAALIAAYTGRPAREVTGRGTGVDDATLDHKVGVVERALSRATGDPLAEVGGLEIAALAGYILEGTQRGVPVLIDGVIACAALLASADRDPAVVDGCIAGHLSTEPGAAVALDHLGLEPLLDLSLRLGEGTGAVLALHLVRAAALVLNEMATFDSAGVSEKT
jgi:nicotinate-nucleotide--dimethylbenzimidazole phosphoribosyltransferase